VAGPKAGRVRVNKAQPVIVNSPPTLHLVGGSGALPEISWKGKQEIAMRAKGLLERIVTEANLESSAELDQDVLSGVFNRYRPTGEGLERILGKEGVEGKVRARIKRVIEVTASSLKPDDWYFVLRYPQPIDRDDAVKLVESYLRDLAQLAEFAGADEARDAISSLAVVQSSNTSFTRDESVPTLIYECLTDFLAGFQPDQNELFALKEALYSMANDYFLMAYMVWPAVQESTGLPTLLDSYFEVWSHGISLDFSTDGSVFVRIAA
jgi:hypothetical protein